MICARDWGAGLSAMVCLAVGCGGSVDLDTPQHAGAAGSGGKSQLPPGGGAQAGTSEPSHAGETDAGANGGAGTAGVGVQHDGGEGGAGGTKPGSVEGYSLTLIPPLAPLKDLASESEIVLQAVTPDGSLMIGASNTKYPELFGYPGYFESRMFMWTPEGGSQPLPFLEIGEQPDFNHKSVGMCPAEDGSRVLFSFDRAKSDAAIHDWVLWMFTPKTGGLEEIQTGMTSPTLGGCSADAKRALLVDDCPNCARWHFWQLGQGSAIDVAPFDGYRMWLSKEGDVQVLSTYSGQQYFSWVPGASTDLHVGPDCSLSDPERGWSGDGSVMLGFCSVGNGLATARWKDGTKTLLDTGVNAHAVSRDGSTIVGAHPSADPADQDGTAYIWRNDESMRRVTISETSYVFEGIAHDGSSSYYNAYSEPDAFAVRYSEEDGVVPLLGVTATDLTYMAAFSVTPGPWAVVGTAGPTIDTGIGMLWDASGARQIVKELREAGVDLSDIGNIIPERVWVDSSIHVQGKCDSAGLCIAQLPLR